MNQQRSNNIKVLLVDDHDVVRDGMRVMLASALDIEITHEARTAAEAMQIVQDHAFDVALIDIALPGKNGLDLAKLLRSKKPGIGLLIFSMYSERIYAMRALKLGVSGYLTKNSQASTVIAAIRKVASGGKFITPDIAEKIADSISGHTALAVDVLTDRELEVLRLLVAGETTAAIGKILHISPSTVATYKTRIFEKTGLQSDRELFRYAFENSIFT